MPDYIHLALLLISLDFEHTRWKRMVCAFELASMQCNAVRHAQTMRFRRIDGVFEVNSTILGSSSSVAMHCCRLEGGGARGAAINPVWLTADQCSFHQSINTEQEGEELCICKGHLHPLWVPAPEPKVVLLGVALASFSVH